MVSSLPEDQQERLYSEVPGLEHSTKRRKYKDTGKPAKDHLEKILKREKFDELRLLSRFSLWVSDIYVRYIRNKQIRTSSFKDIDPTYLRDYVVATDTLFSEINATVGDTTDFHIFNPSLQTVTDALSKLVTKFCVKYWKVGKNGVPEEYGSPARLRIDLGV